MSPSSENSSERRITRSEERPIGAGNIIAYNGHNGVTVGEFSFDSSTVEDPILSNSIFANAALGIDLGDDGVTPNNSGLPNPVPMTFRTTPTS